MIIQHNKFSSNTSRMLGMATWSFEKSAEKLSSGYKINRAADDGAGLAISEKMRKQIRGLSQAVRNAHDGISLCQIADGALEESTSMIHRIRELSIQAANGTQSLSDRQSVQEEIDRLISEIDKISATTQFNTINLLDGTIGRSVYPGEGEILKGLIPTELFPLDETTFYISPDSDATFTIKLPVIDSSATASKGKAAVEKLENDLINSIVPQSIKGIAAAFPSLAKAIADGQVSSQIGLKLYSEKSSTLAYVGYSTWALSGYKIDHIDLSLNVNVNSLSFKSDGTLTDESRQDLESTIIHEMMHAFSVDVMTNGMVNAKDFVYMDPDATRFPIWFQEGIAQAASGGMDWTQYSSGLGITPSSTEPQIKTALKASGNNIVYGGSLSDPVTQYGTGYLAVMYLGYLASGGTTMNEANVAKGVDSILASIMSGYSLSDTIKNLTGGKYSDLMDFQRKFGDDSASFVKQLVTAAGRYSPTAGGRGALVGGSFTKRDLVADSNTTSAAYKPDKNNEYVTSNPKNRNENSGGGQTNSGTVTPGGGTGPTPGPGPGPGPTPGPTPDPGPPKPPDPPKPNNPSTPTQGGTGIIVSKGKLNLHVGADAGTQITLRIDEISAKTLGINGLSVTSINGCYDAMHACEYALTKITSQRAEIGAVVNRLEHTVLNLDNVIENTTSAESLIRDTDIAKTMVDYSKIQILQQSGMSILAQVNKNNEGVLALLS